MNEDHQIEAVRAVLAKFQEGYVKRDQVMLDEIMDLFIPEDDLELIGTGGHIPGEDEWCLGLPMAREVVSSDWKGWGDVRYDVQGARIHVLGDAAWLATAATVCMKLPIREGYQNLLDYLKDSLQQPADDPALVVMDILRRSSNTLYEFSLGEDFIWPLRFTAVLVKRQEKWLFAQMQFSFSTTRFPDVRLTN
ncbi:MAG: nuclear transport factor 2 family protein [Anaerolineaceae bacterium]|nr:nuclear transport factor 2 family protein [Anaerolineaceae bacterium]